MAMHEYRFLPGPLEGVMRRDFVAAANALELFRCWVTPFFRFSDALPRRRVLEEFLTPFKGGNVPVFVQIMGTEPRIMAAGAAAFAALGAAGIDINCGCPSKQVTGGGAGGGMLRDIARMLQTVAAVKREIGDLPLSVKLRTGWSSPDEMADFLPRLTGCGFLSGITVHFRTVSEQYRSVPSEERAARWRRAAELLAPLPLTVNGDMTTTQEMLDDMNGCGAAAAMAARGVLRDPFLLRRANGMASPEVDEGRHIFYREVRRQAGGNLPAGQAIELTNFMWGKENPYFAELKKEFER